MCVSKRVSKREPLRQTECSTAIVCARVYSVLHVYMNHKKTFWHELENIAPDVISVEQKFSLTRVFQRWHRADVWRGAWGAHPNPLDEEEKITVCHNSGKRLHRNCWWRHQKQRGDNVKSGQTLRTVSLTHSHYSSFFQAVVLYLKRWK